MSRKFLLHKLISGIYRTKDIDELGSYMNTREGMEEFQNLSQTIWEESQELNKENQVNNDEAIEFIRRLQKSKKKKRISLYISIAASIFILLAIGYNVHKTDPKITTDIRMIASQVVQTDKNNEIQLILGDADPIKFRDDTVNVKHQIDGQVEINEEKLNSENSEDALKNKYNRLIVPKGKRSTLQLADDIFIWVNAGTTVIYPIEMKGIHEIFVDGEVYVQVQPSADNNKRKPFYVRTANLNIEVTGTKFNVTAYHDEETESVVLVSGSVNVYAENKKESKLVPNEQLIYDIDGNLSVHDVKQCIILV